MVEYSTKPALMQWLSEIAVLVGLGLGEAVGQVGWLVVPGKHL
jgi:hypothetical protein